MSTPDERFPAIATFGCAVLVISIVLFVINLAFLIPSFVVAQSNFNSTCDGSVIGLRPWLLADASVMAFLCFTIVILLSGFCGSRAYIHSKPLTIYLVIVLLISFIYTMFTVAWNIVGDVAFFRDSSACNGYPIGEMVKAILIFHWVIIGFNILFIPFIIFLLITLWD